MERRRAGIKFWVEIAVAAGVAINIALTLGILIVGGRQVTASQNQLEIMRDSERKQLKAYVGLTQHGIQNFGTPTQTLKISRKNYGLTPAIDLFMTPPNIAVVQIDRLTQFAPTLCTPAPTVVNSFTLFPQQESNFEMRGHNITLEQVDLVKKGTTFVIMYWGALFYKDVFGNRHCSRYCWTFKGADMSEAAADTCFQHNDFHDLTEEEERAKQATEKAASK